MSQSTLQSALLLPKVGYLPFGAATPPGAALTVPVPGAELDLDGYATRDRELQWRDYVVASALDRVTRRAATVFGVQLPRLRLCTEVEDIKIYSSTAAYAASATVPIGPNSESVSFVRLSAPVLPGTITVTVLKDGVPISTTTDDWHRRLISLGSATDPDALTPKGAVVGGFINYDQGTVRVLLKPYPGQALTCQLSYGYGATSRPRGNVAANSGVYSDMLTLVPVAKTSVTVSVGGYTSGDNGLGRLTPVGVILGGTVDYMTGQVQVVVKPSIDTRPVEISYGHMVELPANQGDLSPSQRQDALGGITGVRYVTNQSVPLDALASDQDLYRRDLVLYEAITRADAVFSNLSTPWSIPKLDPTVPASALEQLLGDYWSEAAASSSFSLPARGDFWGPGVYANPDKYLAWRDNAVAAYVAEISEKLAHTLRVRSELQALAAENHTDLLVEDA